MKLKHIFFVGLLLFCKTVLAHPMPSSIVNLSVGEHTISGEAKMPLLELENALGIIKPDNNLDVNTAFFKSYFHQHIQASSNGKNWATIINSIHTTKDMDSMIGEYHEVIVDFSLMPANNNDLHKFIFNYDAIIHQVVTHKILVFVEQDWNNGLSATDMAQQVGIIKTDFVHGGRQPLQVDLEPGSKWKGFSKMINLGMEHIEEGTDHLLFLLVLLLPAMLLVRHKKWSACGGLRYSLPRLFKITSAFTIGHSVTLLFGSMQWLVLPSAPVETLIAVSILVSAVHAIRPIFPNKEIYVAGGFGLIHGLAFASVLANMNLSATTLALSILGFNIGIEVMQLFIICLVIPWLILLAKTRWYAPFRVAGASCAGIAAMGWIAEKTLGRANVITELIDALYPHLIWCIAGLALVSVGLYRWHFMIKKQGLFSTTDRMFQ